MTEKSGCNFCSNKESEHGFFIDANVLFYKWGRTRSGPEGIIIHFCPYCGKDLDTEQIEVSGEREHKEGV